MRVRRIAFSSLFMWMPAVASTTRGWIQQAATGTLPSLVTHECPPAPAIVAPVSPAIEPANGQTGGHAPPEKAAISALPLAAEPLRRPVTRPSVPSIMPHAYVPRESWADEDEDKPRRENFWIAFAVVLAVMGIAVGYLSLRSDDAPEKPAAGAAKEQRPADAAPADQPKPSPAVPASPAAARAPGRGARADE